jgi:hypothetical protein
VQAQLRPVVIAALMAPTDQTFKPLPALLLRPGAAVVAERLGRYEAAGVTTLIVAPLGEMIDERLRMLRLPAEMAGGQRPIA